jgi:hypothetical protein
MAKKHQPQIFLKKYYFFNKDVIENNNFNKDIIENNNFNKK